MIRILIVDDACEICDVLGPVITQQPDMQVVGCTNSFAEAMAQVENSDLMLVSTSLPGDDAYNLARAITKSDFCSKILIVGQNAPKELIVHYIEAGALGYVQYDSRIEEVLKQIRSIHAGRVLVDPEVAAKLVIRLAQLSCWFEEQGLKSSEATSLTRREREVLRLIGRDFTNQDIANHLIIEVGTVKNHVHNILSKLNVSSRREAASYLPVVAEWPVAHHNSSSYVSREGYLS